MAMNNGGSSALTSNANARRARRRSSGRPSFKSLSGMLPLNNYHTSSSRIEELEDESGSNDQEADNSMSFSERCMSMSVPGFRSRDVEPFGSLDDDTEEEEEEDLLSSKKPKARVSVVMPAIRRVMSLQVGGKAEKQQHCAEKAATQAKPNTNWSSFSRNSTTLPTRPRTPPPPSEPNRKSSGEGKRAPPLPTQQPKRRESGEGKIPGKRRDGKVFPQNTRRSPSRDSGPVLKRASKRPSRSPTRPSRRASPPPRPSDGVPDLEPCAEKEGLFGFLKPPSLQKRPSDGVPDLEPGVEKEGLFGFVPSKDIKNKDISISPPRLRERSKSPFRRTRSAVDAPSVLKKSKGSLIDDDDWSDSDDDEVDFRSPYDRVSPKRSQSPMRRSVSGGAIVAASMKVKGTLSKADLAPRIPNGRNHNINDMAPRMPNLSRGRSLGNAATALALKRRGNASPSPTNNNSGSDDNGIGPLKRVAPGRSRSGGAALLLRGSLTRGDTKLSSSVPSKSPTALVGRGVRATISASSDLAAMQMALGRSAAKTAAKTTSAVTAGVTVGGAAIMGGLRATKSASLADMQRALGAAGRRSSVFAVSVTEAQPDPLFVEMTQWNPLDDDDRAKYDDVAVKRLIHRNPDAVKAKYTVQVGRSTVTRSALSTIVALGASLETVRAAIKANSAALRPCSKMRTTPLHTACSFNTDMMVVRYIYHKYPEAIKATTKHVFLPLHNACQMNTPSMEMIQFLVESYPEGLTEINKLGDTPLRTAERNTTTPEEVLEFLEEETDRIFSQNAETEIKRKQVAARQSWGSKELAMAALLLDDTDHTTTSSAFMDQSENSASDEFSNEFAGSHSLPDLSRSEDSESGQRRRG